MTRQERRLRSWSLYGAATPSHRIDSRNPADAPLFKDRPAARRARSLRSRKLLIRLALAVALFVLLLFWYGRRRDDNGSFSAWRSSKKGWASSQGALPEISPVQLPLPYENYTWTTLYAGVETGDGPEDGQQGRYVEILAFVPGPSGNRAHIFSTNLEDVLGSVSCDFGRGETTLAQSILTGAQPRVLLYRCPLPSTMERDPSAIALRLAFKNGEQFMQKIHVEPLATAPPVGAIPELAICVSPMYGRYNKLALLEWRLHHAQLGVQAAHWYGREKDSPLEEWMYKWNDILGLQDTWRYAPHLGAGKPEVSKLYSGGAYADQVAYHMDCLARTRHSIPADWVSLIDFDEFYLPNTFTDVIGPGPSSSGLLSFLHTQGNASIASICISRINTRGPPLLMAPPGLSSQPPSLIYLGTRDPPPSLPASEWSFKCMHRPKAVELAFTHWPESFRQGQPDEVAWFEEVDQGVPVLAHLRQGDMSFSTFAEPYPVTQELRNWVKALWQKRDELAEKL